MILLILFLLITPCYAEIIAQTDDGNFVVATKVLTQDDLTREQIKAQQRLDDVKSQCDRDILYAEKDVNALAVDNQQAEVMVAAAREMNLGTDKGIYVGIQTGVTP